MISKLLLANLCLFLSLSTTSSALAAPRIQSDTFPEVAQVGLDNHLEGYSLTVVRKHGDTWAFLVSVQAAARHPVGRGSGPDTHAVDFVPVRGILHRVGAELFWSVDGQELLVATRRGWIRGWEMSKDVRVQVFIEHYRYGSYGVSLKLDAN